MKSSGSEATVASRDPEEILKEVRAALEREPRVRLDRRSIRIAFNEVDDTVTLQGEAPDIAVKKLAWNWPPPSQACAASWIGSEWRRASG